MLLCTLVDAEGGDGGGQGGYIRVRERDLEIRYRWFGLSWR